MRYLHRLGSPDESMHGLGSTGALATEHQPVALRVPHIPKTLRRLGREEPEPLRSARGSQERLPALVMTDI